jgi:hypothetical protein
MSLGPDIYDSAPWSGTDIEDLKNRVAWGATFEETAEFLCRAGTWEDVAAKAKELGLKWQMGGRRRKAKGLAVAVGPAEKGSDS